VLHLAGSIQARQCYRVVHLHSREVVRGARRLAKALVRWTAMVNPAQEAMEAISSMVFSLGVIRTALELRARGRLPGVQPAEAEAARLEQVESLSARLAEADADRAARLVQIETLTGWLREAEAGRPEQVALLGARLAEAEADRAARLVQIETLTGWLREAEADRAARLVQIETLTRWLRETEAARDAHAAEAARLRARLDGIERSWVERAHRLLGGRKKRSGA
jgi:hypothetical protein